MLKKKNTYKKKLFHETLFPPIRNKLDVATNYHIFNLNQQTKCYMYYPIIKQYTLIKMHIRYDGCTNKKTSRMFPIITNVRNYTSIHTCTCTQYVF